MNTCKTCKYWADKYNIKNNIADCGFIQGTGATKDRLTYFDIEISVDDGSNLNYDLMTGANFGCIHHKNKVEND